MSGLRAAVYIRVSDPRQVDGYSLETQLVGCKTYAVNLGLTVVREFQETHTGVDLFERPELTKLRAAMAQGEFDHLIVYVLDRLSREPMHTGLIFSEASYFDVQVHSVLEKIEDTDEGRLLVNITGYVAKKEHAKITERTQRGRRARAISGKYMNGGRPRYGYRWQDASPHAKDRLEPDPSTAPVVQRIFTLASEGVPLRSIAMRLTSEGVPTPFAGLVCKRGLDRTPLERYPYPGVWSGPTIGDILRDPTYTGRATAYRTQRIRRNGRTVDIPRALEDQIALPEGVVIPLVSTELFQGLQGRLKRNQEQAARNNKTPEDALLRSGFAFCGVCGCNLIVHHRTDSRRTPVYQCDNVRRHNGTPTPGMTATDLDRAVWSHVEEILTNPDVVTRELERLRGDDPTAADISALDRRLSEVSRQQRNLVANLALVDGEAAAMVAERIKELGEQRRRLQAEREGVIARRASWETAQAQLRQVEAWCQKVASSLDQLDYKQRRLALEALGTRTILWPANHTPRWRLECTLPLDGDNRSSSPIVKVDDVATTGCTLNACGRALLDAGATAVYALVLARRSLDDERRTTVKGHP